MYITYQSPAERHLLSCKSHREYAALEKTTDLENGIQDDGMDIVVSFIKTIDVAPNPGHGLCFVHAEPVDSHESDMMVSDVKICSGENVLGTKLGIGCQLLVKFLFRIRFGATFDDFVDVHFCYRTRTQVGRTVANFPRECMVSKGGAFCRTHSRSPLMF
jgi:hypothetical protein